MFNFNSSLCKFNRIGGPLRNICKFTGADVTGLTLNQYQVDRGNELCRSDPLIETSKCRLVQGDFMNMGKCGV